MGELAKMEAQAKSIENEAHDRGRDRAGLGRAGDAAPARRAREAAPGVRRRAAGRGGAPGRGGPGARRGGAARGERASAAAEALSLLAAQWQAAGPERAARSTLLQQLRSFVEAAVARVAQTKVGELTIVDGGDGAAYAAFVANFPPPSRG